VEGGEKPKRPIREGADAVLRQRTTKKVKNKIKQREKEAKKRNGRRYSPKSIP